MAQPHRLSSNEVAALVGGLMNMDQDDSSNEDGKDVRSYEFGTDDLSLMGDYYALRMINERFCRIARSVFLPMLRIQPRISAFPPEVKRFEEYVDGLENFVSLTISRIDELRGNSLTVLHPSFVSLLTDSYFGGKVRDIATNRNEFTATESRVIELVTDGLNQALEMAWRDLVHLTFRAQNREENLQFASFVDNDDMIINCSFLVQLPSADPAMLDILYPLQVLKPIASQLRSRMTTETLNADESWQHKLTEALMDVPLDVRVQLAEPTVKLGRLIGIKPDTVVPVELKPDLHMIVADHPMFNVELGAVGPKSAVSVVEERRIGDK